MSWATHELENYFIQKHGGLRISFLAVAVGAFAPDFFTKGFVYGMHIGDFGVQAPADAIQFHRGWPGVGFTHSLLFGAIVAVLILRFSGSRAWALGFLIGAWAHVITDINDSAGTMLFFPFSIDTVTTGMWKHAAYTGRYTDAAAYYSSPGGVWDTFWLLVVVLFARQTLTSDYFRNTVVAADPRAWGWIHRKFKLPERALLAIYRGWLFYAACRIVAWTIYARVVVDAPWDPTWGGPFWITAKRVSPDSGWAEVRSLSIGAACTMLALFAIWKLYAKKWWDRASDPPVLAAAKQGGAMPALAGDGAGAISDPSPEGDETPGVPDEKGPAGG
jgi:LexA-binding, inner membrane-associated putative hydrolase